MDNNQKAVVIIGGAVAGSEAAFQFAEKGYYTIIIEKNAMPYGKIEDGLPKWHVKLRNREINRINDKLNHPLVTYIPNTELGKNLSIEEVINWNVDAVVLANGAWQDRPLPIEGIENFVNDGVIYQNDFIYWFNHQHEPDYKGPVYQTKNNTIIIGGGLASIDCAKATMFYLVNKALNNKGINSNLFEMEHGINKVLDKHNLTIDDLDIEPCTIYYRKRCIDMPLTPQEIDSPEALEKAQRTRLKIIEHNKTKYLFKVRERAAPVAPIVENGLLKGMLFNNTFVDDNTYHKIENDTFEVRCPQIISSIGSLPVPLPGLTMDGSVYQFEDEATCRLKGFEQVYALGNAVTGRGNINQSLKHATAISQLIIDELANQAPRNTSVKQVEDQVRQLQQRVAYNGDYSAWINQHMPVRLEDMIEH